MDISLQNFIVIKFNIIKKKTWENESNIHLNVIKNHSDKKLKNMKYIWFKENG